MSELLLHPSKKGSSEKKIPFRVHVDLFTEGD